MNLTNSQLLARNAAYTMDCHSTVDAEGYCVGCRTYHGALDKPGDDGCYFYRLANDVYRKHNPDPFPPAPPRHPPPILSADAESANTIKNGQ